MTLDLAILNVDCLTLDEKKPRAQAVGLKGPYIHRVGTNQEIKEDISSTTEVIDGGGKTLLPGFSDAHTHFTNLAIRMSCYFELGHIKSRAELMELVKKEASRRERGQWVTGIAWDESKWEGDRTFLTREELDSLAPHHPVALIRVDGHICCVNSEALKILDYPPRTRGVEVRDGEPTGRLVEDAGFNVRYFTEPGIEEIHASLKEAMKRAHSLGLTAIHDVWLNNDKMKAYQLLHREKELRLRVGMYLGDEYLQELDGDADLLADHDDFLRLLGVKVFVDGSIGASTAMVEKGYLKDPENRGYPMQKREDLFAILSTAQKNDIPLAIHAIGDLAIEEALDGLEEAGCRKKRLGHRLEHVECVSREQIRRMKELGLTASMQPNFTGEWGHPGSMYEDRFGPDFIKTMNPLRWIVDEGVTLLLGSDGMPFNPLYGIHSAVNPPFSCQRLTPLEALRAYSRCGAGEHPGIITSGGLADMVLLEGDPLKESEAIKEFEVLMTLFHGQVVYAK